MKTYLTFFVVIFLVFCCTGCFETAPVAFGYTNIKEVPNSDQYEATGYFTNDPTPMLVNDPKWLTVNMPMPANAYLFLAENSLDSIINPDSTRLYGALLKIRGTAQKDSTFMGKKVLRVENVEINGNSTDDRGPSIVDHCALPGPASCVDICADCPVPPNLCDISTPSTHKFALLFSGGLDYPNAKFRYWNDLEFMYLTLRSQYGFSDANMAVLYMDKTKENPASPMDVDYPASRKGLEDAIAYLNSIMHNHSGTSGLKDTLFVFVTNHGGGHDMFSVGSPISGAMDGGPTGLGTRDEDLDPEPKFDEIIYYYQPSPDGTSEGSIKDDFWQSKWSGLLTSKNPLLISLYEQCFSGGFLYDMRAPKRVNIAAASENGYSYSMPSDNIYDAFSYHFTAALYGRNADGSCLKTSPDINNDKAVSIWEAYQFAHLNDLPHDTHRHFLDDVGSGIGIEGITPTPTPLSGGQGVFSLGLFLK